MSRLLLSAFLSLMPCVCFAADRISLPKPFGDKAITRVHDLIPTMPEELDKYLSHVEEYGYDFGDVKPGCPAPVYCTGLPENESYAIVKRFANLSLADFISEIRKELDKHEFSGCSWLRFPNLRVMYQAPTKVTYVADISATKRACADTPFGEVKTDLASASGTVTVSVELLLTAPTLETEFSPGAFRVRVNDPIVNISKRTLLGFINADSLVGKIVQELGSLVDFLVKFDTLALVDLKVDELRRFMNVGGLSGSVAQQATQRVEGLSSITELTRGLEGLQFVEKMYALDTSATQFFYVDSTPHLNHVELTVTRAANLPLYRSLKVSELKLIASLDKDAKQYTVAAGDRLWDIVKAEYGSEALWLPLAAWNKLQNPNRLKINSVVILPALWQIQKQDECLIRPGETLWGRFVREHDPREWDPKNLKPLYQSKSINEIFASQCDEQPAPNGGKAQL